MKRSQKRQLRTAILRKLPPLSNMASLVRKSTKTSNCWSCQKAQGCSYAPAVRVSQHFCYCPNDHLEMSHEEGRIECRGFIRRRATFKPVSILDSGIERKEEFMTFFTQWQLCKPELGVK